MITETVNSADGTPIVYHRTGEGPSVLFVHGTIATTELYQSIAEQLRTDHQVVLMERRGYRISGDGARPGTFAQQALDIAAVLGTIDEPRYVFGHSFGGLATLHALASVADRLSAVALYEPPAALAGPPLVPTLAKCREAVDADRTADAILAFWSSVGDPDPTMARLAPMLAHRAYGLIEDLECMTSMSVAADRWPIGDLPILLMSGSATDMYAKDSIALLERELSPRDTVVLPGQHHHPDDPLLVADALRAFFAKS